MSTIALSNFVSGNSLAEVDGDPISSALWEHVSLWRASTQRVVGAAIDGDIVDDFQEKFVDSSIEIERSLNELIIGERANAKLRLTRQVLQFAEDSMWDDRESAIRAKDSIREALVFLSLYPRDAAVPFASAAGDGVVSFEWEAKGKKAMAMFEGDGEYGYAYFVDGRFKPGKHQGVLSDTVPEDLTAYLMV